MKIIDLNFLGHQHTIAAFLLESTAGPILFETGPYSTFPFLKEGIQKLGYSLTDIQHVFITHIHLDHAGAAWALAEHGARIYVHPFGYEHMKNPGKLLASAIRIYGDDMDRLWGTLKPIPENQLSAIEDESVVNIGEHQIKAWHTPGHAVHHIAWQIDDQIIAGDVAGVKILNGPVVPPCPPPDINIEDWNRSISRLRALSPKAIYLTHYGLVAEKEVDKHLDLLQEKLTDWSEWIKPYFDRGERAADVVPLFQQYVSKQLSEDGLSPEEIGYYERANPSGMSVAGLMRYWKKRGLS